MLEYLKNQSPLVSKAHGSKRVPVLLHVGLLVMNS